MNIKPMRRRLFLFGLVLASASGTLAIRKHVVEARDERAAHQFLALLGIDDDVAPLGHAFLQDSQPQRNLHDLLVELEVRLGKGFRSSDIADIKALVHTAITDDFDRGDVVDVRGWLLPRTTVLLAAASVQLQPRAARRTRTSS